MMDRNEEQKGYLERRKRKDIQKGGTEWIFRMEEQKGYIEKGNRKEEHKVKIEKRNRKDIWKGGTERMYRKEEIKENIRYIQKRVTERYFLFLFYSLYLLSLSSSFSLLKNKCMFLFFFSPFSWFFFFPSSCFSFPFFYGPPFTLYLSVPPIFSYYICLPFKVSTLKKITDGFKF